MGKLGIFLILQLALIAALTVGAAPMPVGDGITNDLPAFRVKFAELAHGGVMDLKARGVYILRGESAEAPDLVRERAIILRGNGARIVIAKGPANHKIAFRLQPKLGEIKEWQEPLRAGDRPAATQPVIKGKKYLAAYGNDPYDFQQEHAIRRSDEIGLPPAPYAINKEWHYYQELLTSIDGSIIQDLIIEQEDGTNVDYGIGVDKGQGIILRNISSPGISMLFQITDSAGVIVDRAKCKAVTGQNPQDGRFATVWQSQMISFLDCEVWGRDDRSLFMFESQNRGIDIVNGRFHIEGVVRQGAWPMPLIVSQGGTKGVRIWGGRSWWTSTLFGYYDYDTGGQLGIEPIQVIDHRFSGKEWGPNGRGTWWEVPFDVN